MGRTITKTPSTRISTITEKGQTTVPKEIRDYAHLLPGDRIVYEIDEDGAIRIRRLHPLDEPYYASLSSTLEEWASREDEEAFDDL